MSAGDEVVLGVVVEAQIGAHLGTRHGLDGGPATSIGIIRFSGETSSRLSFAACRHRPGTHETDRIDGACSWVPGSSLRGPGMRRVDRAALTCRLPCRDSRGAIVGGARTPGRSSRASVMVLSSKGGVCSAVVVAARRGLDRPAIARPARAEHRGPLARRGRRAGARRARREGGASRATTPRRSRRGGARSTSRSSACRAPARPLRGRGALGRTPVGAGARHVRRLRRRHARATRARAAPSARRRCRSRRALRPRAHPDLGRGRRARRRLPGRFRRADARRAGAVFAITTWVGGRRRGACGRLSQGVLARPAARLDRPYARGVGAQGGAWEKLADTLRSGAANLERNPSAFRDLVSPEVVDNGQA